MARVGGLHGLARLGADIHPTGLFQTGGVRDGGLLRKGTHQ